MARPLITPKILSFALFLISITSFSEETPPDIIIGILVLSENFSKAETDVTESFRFNIGTSF